MPAGITQAAKAAAATSTDHTLPVILALGIAALIALLLSLIAGGLMRRVLNHLAGDHARSRAMSRATVRLARLLIFAIAAVSLASPALEFAGVAPAVGPGSAALGHWVARIGVRVSVILLGAFAVNYLVASLIQRAEDELQAESSVSLHVARQRAQTLAASLQRILSVVIWSVTLLMVLRELDVDITPILTGAGILGLAVGFGAQTLVRDVITGFFLIVEDQIRVGDVAVVNGTGGSVEEINLRTIVLRDAEGTVHIFPNGEIKTLANRTRDFAYAVVDLPMDYGDDADRVMDAARAAAEDLRQDEAWAKNIVEPLEMLGVDAFTAAQVTLKMRIRTVPGRQWDVGRELRRRIKKVFDQRGIKMPSPQLTVTLRNAPAGPGAGGPGAAISDLPSSPAVQKHDPPD